MIGFQPTLTSLGFCRVCPLSSYKPNSSISLPPFTAKSNFSSQTRSCSRRHGSSSLFLISPSKHCHLSFKLVTNLLFLFLFIVAGEVFQGTRQSYQVYFSFSTLSLMDLVWFLFRALHLICLSPFGLNFLTWVIFSLKLTRSCYSFQPAKPVARTSEFTLR